MKEAPPLRTRHRPLPDRRASFVDPYLDEYRSDLDKLGTVEKRRLVAFQRRQARPNRIHIRRATDERSFRSMPPFLRPGHYHAELDNDSDLGVLNILLSFKLTRRFIFSCVPEVVGEQRCWGYRGQGRGVPLKARRSAARED